MELKRSVLSIFFVIGILIVVETSRHYARSFSRSKNRILPSLVSPVFRPFSLDKVDIISNKNHSPLLYNAVSPSLIVSFRNHTPLENEGSQTNFKDESTNFRDPTIHGRVNDESGSGNARGKRRQQVTSTSWSYRHQVLLRSCFFS